MAKIFWTKCYQILAEKLIPMKEWKPMSREKREQCHPQMEQTALAVALYYIKLSH